MSLWTKLAAVFSIMASAITIYSVAFRPKDAPSVWAQFFGAGGDSAKVCAIIKKGPSAQGYGLLRSGPGKDHPQVATLATSAHVIVVEKADAWSLVREDEGLSASVQGWIETSLIDKSDCRAATAAPVPAKATATPPAKSEPPAKKP